MYNEKIEKLMEYALSDRVITEKEKEILFRKAAEEGIDSDEFEMVLYARLYDKQKREKQANNVPNKHGDIRKCPACGALVESFSIKCTYCDYEYSNVKANTSIINLFKVLNLVREAPMFGDKEKLALMTEVYDNEKREIIKNFPIPTTKDDILEFLTMAIPNATERVNTLNDDHHHKFKCVWRSKCEQIILKAQLSMKNDKSTLDEILRYAKKLNID